MHFEIITLFPEMFDGFFQASIIGRAKAAGIFSENRILLRKYALNRYGQVDDAPYGGQAGMVLRAEPAAKAIGEAAANCGGRPVRRIFFTPQGVPLTQKLVIELSAAVRDFVLFCGHYKGLDERVCEKYIDLEVSAGDYVLTGGELPAMMFIDALVRLDEGALGNTDSAGDDSFMRSGLLEHPLYTRPEVFEGSPVPEVLRSGHPKRIEEWKQYERLKRTWLRRPDLLREEVLRPEEREMLIKIKGDIACTHSSGNSKRPS
jgi:tRNA (guanine37-N1)-methyltransferase